MSGERSQAAQGRTVLFVTNTLGYGGSEKHLIELVERLDDTGFRSVILCAKTDPYTERLNGKYGVSVSVRRENTLHSPANWFHIFREIRPAVVVFIYGTLLDIPWYVSAAGWLAGVRNMYSIQHLIPPPVPPRIEGKTMFAVLRRLVGRRTRQRITVRLPPRLCVKTICVSDAVRDSLVRNYGFPPAKTLTIRNGVSLSEFGPTETEGFSIREKLGLRAEDFVLVCAARLSEEKAIDILLQAMSLLVRRNLPCKCIILGDGYLKDSLSAQIQTLDLTKHVFMEGFQEDVRPYLLASDAFVLTSHKEGLPFAVLEAMACGLPCVVTNVGGNAEAVAHNVNGLVVNPGSPDEVAEAVSYLVRHPKERAQMSQASRSRALGDFDIEARMADIKDVILGPLVGTSK